MGRGPRRGCVDEQIAHGESDDKQGQLRLLGSVMSQVVITSCYRSILSAPRFPPAVGVLIVPTAKSSLARGRVFKSIGSLADTATMEDAQGTILRKGSDPAGKALEDAMRKVAEGKPPRLRDYAILANAGLKPNTLLPVTPRFPRAGSREAHLLQILWGRGPIKIAEALSEWQSFTGHHVSDDAIRFAIGRLRDDGWWVENPARNTFQLLPLGLPPDADWMQPLSQQEHLFTAADRPAA